MSWDERRRNSRVEKWTLSNLFAIKKSLGTSTKQLFSGYAARKLVEKETEERAEIVGRL